MTTNKTIRQICIKRARGIIYTRLARIIRASNKGPKQMAAEVMGLASDLYCLEQFIEEQVVPIGGWASCSDSCEKCKASWFSPDD